MKTGDKYFCQGIYEVQNKDKYIGKENPKFRSSWERVCCYWFDNNPKIKKWGYECLSITYYSPIDSKVHRYFPDFYIEVEDYSGNQLKYLVEVKPYEQTIPPKQPKRKTKKYLLEAQTYVTNQCKWEAAKKMCATRGIIFKLITEKDIFV